MGVTNLWSLLDPVGRRINVEALTGKILAVDASIWLIQFLKAMRDDRGDPMKNAHLLGFFRRICRLLFHRIRPVFVFDGATPALKRRTVIARRRRREQHTSKLKKTAEKLLMNQLKQHALSTLAGDGASIPKPKKKKAKKNAAKDQEEMDPGKGKSRESGNDAPLENTKIDLSRSAAGEGPSQPALSSGGFVLNEDAAMVEEDLTNGQTEPSKEPIREEELADSDGDSSDFALDLPDDLTSLDPEVLFTLPPSIQYDVILQMREKQFGENRETFVSLTGQPENFSDHQMATYLKASEFRRKLEDTRKQVGQSMGINGAQVQKIASEPNRSYVFQTNLEDGKKSSLGNLSAQGATLSAMLQQQKPMEKETPPPTPEEDPSIPTKTLDITFEVPLSSSSEEEIEWEDEEEEEDPQGGKDGKSNDDVSGSPTQKPPTVTRQKFWSLSHGFKMGRSLGQWGVDEGHEEEQGELEGNDKAKFDSEDAQLQEALRRSIQDATGKSKIPEAPFRIMEGRADQVEVGTIAQSLTSEDFVLPNPVGRRYSDEGPSMASPQPVPMRKSVRFADSEEPRDMKETGNEAGAEAIDFDFLDAFVETEQQQGGGGEAVEEEVICRVVAPTAIDMEVLETGPGAPTSLPSRQPGEAPLESASSHKAKEKERHQVDFDMDTHIHNVEAADKDFEAVEEHAKNHAGGVGGSGPGCAAPVAQREEAVEVDAEVTAGPSFDAGQKSPVHVGHQSPAETPGRNPCRVPGGVDADAPKSSHCGFVTEDLPSQPRHEQPALTSTGMQHIPAMPLPSVSESSEQKLPVPVETTGQRNGAPPETLEQSQRIGHDVGMQEELEQLDLEEELALLQTETQFLEEQQKRLTRHAETPTPQMYAECQELLQMFGLPYIIAPMEAEAQCAFLNGAGLVDGVVTEDNDVFLFGGRMVYKNLFENKKYVEEYNMQDIESELGLDQQRLIQMAMLLGSDYTEGISGIGIVNATEVVQAFSGPDGPKAFRDWVNSPDEHLVSVARASSKGEAGSSGATISGLDNDDPGLRKFKITHRAARKNWELPESFPNPAVVEAYITPKVDGSKEKFTFGRPDLEMLRSFCSERFGWDYGNVDELLVPVMKAYDQRQTQLRIDSFISFRQRFAKIKSKRLQKAVAGITGAENEEIALGQAEAPPEHATVKKRSKMRGEAETSRVDETENRLGENPGAEDKDGAHVSCSADGNGVEERTGKSSSRRGSKRRGAGADRAQQKKKKTVKRVAQDSEEEMDLGADHDSDAQPQESVVPARSLPSRKTRLDVSYLEADDGSGDGGDDPDWAEG
ncbi:hypothetical protein BSKO_08049 [Bryopsis sp. KO-2023]|nr:hypothetical protein BSKO_08049 [Bryopsis sp. KO-2023]